LRPPGGTPANLSEAVLRWPGGSASAVLLDRSLGHAYIEDAVGERVLDVHVSPDQPVTLRVPGQRPLFLRGADGDVREDAIHLPRTVRVSERALAPPSVGRRGGQELAFAQLFSVAFDRSRVRRFTEGWRDVRAAPDLPAEDAPRARSPWARVQTPAAITA